MGFTIYPANALTGGTPGALDALDGALLKDGDQAMVIAPYGQQNPGVYYYELVGDSGETEVVPGVICPDTNAGDKRWKLILFDSNVINQEDKGFFAGGSTGTTVTTTDKLTYATDITTAVTSANLKVARYMPTALTKKNLHGYVSGGDALSSTDKILYAFETTVAQTTSTLSQARGRSGGVSEGGTKGYVAGGWTGGFVATTDKVSFSTETITAQTSANLIGARRDLAGISEGVTKGYFAGGNTGGSNPWCVNATDKITFSTDITAAQGSANLGETKYLLGSVSGDITKGYFSGGKNEGSGTILSATDKITYSNDTRSAQTSANLTVATWQLAGLSEGVSKGYYTSGSWANKITFEIDTTSLCLTAALTQSRTSPAGVSASAV